LLLSAIVLRALIPSGFMPGAHGLEFCDGGIPSAMSSMAGMPGHHHHHHDGIGTPSKSTVPGEGCVFAGSAAGLAPPCLPTNAVPVQASTTDPVSSSAVIWTPTIVRAQTPRGPPTLS